MSLADLESDLRKIARGAPGELKKVVRQAAIVGNTVARDNARRTSGTHGKLYPRSFTWEMSSYAGFGGLAISAVYGPDAGRRQGGMSFEHGSRNQPPHNDLAKSADLIGPTFADETGRAAARMFWPR